MELNQTHQETKSALCEDPRYVLKLGEDDGEDPLHVVLQRRHLVNEPLPSSGKIFELGKAR